MHDPVSTPDGYLFERAAIEAETKKRSLSWTFGRTGPANMAPIP